MTEEQAIERIETLIEKASCRRDMGLMDSDIVVLAQETWNEIKAIALESPETLRQPYEPEPVNVLQGDSMLRPREVV